MRTLDWVVLLATQLFIVGYGILKSRGQKKGLRGYLLSDKDMSWTTVGISIIATQASAITFLSTPGQAFGDGLRFVQFYLAMPLAMVILSVTAVPLYHKLNVYTAYEFLEKRFDVRLRVFSALLFLTQRGLAAGLTIYAPAIILSKVLGIDTSTLTVIVGLIVISYTVTGGAKAVSQTQKQQMSIILVGMIIAACYLIYLLPEDISFGDTLQIAGKMERLNAIDFNVDFSTKYNVWSGLLGGLFLFLSYFGTDQSQVQRYLSAKSVGESRLGMLLNGLLKVPMQLAILFIGVLLFVFYQFQEAPIYFNTTEKALAEQVIEGDQLSNLENAFQENHQAKQTVIRAMLEEVDQNGETNTATRTQLSSLQQKEKSLRDEAAYLIKSNLEKDFDKEKDLPTARKKDRDYVFITFIMNHLPVGLIGLLLSVIVSAAMSSASSELNALGTTSFIDIYKRLINPAVAEDKQVIISKGLTVFWGVVAIVFAQYANRLENLIQAVNTIGSLVYGTILGIFLVAFFFKNIRAKSTLIAAVIAESLVLFIHFNPWFDIPFLWYNVIGCLPVIILAWLMQKMKGVFVG